MDRSTRPAYTARLRWWGELIKTARLARHWSDQELCTAVEALSGGVVRLSRQTLNDLEGGGKGGAKMSLERFLLLVEVLDLPDEVLLQVHPESRMATLVRLVLARDPGFLESLIHLCEYSGPLVRERRHSPPPCVGQLPDTDVSP